MKVLIVIPAYNEEENIETVVDNLIGNYSQYDYVVINDGSTDSTSSICHQKGYNVIDLPVNLGLAGAFKTGLKYAYLKDYDYAIQFDADGQHQAQYIQNIIDEMEHKKCDIVIGSRFVNVRKPLSLRMAGSYLISWAMRLTTHKAITDPTSGMRMFNKKMIKEFAVSLNYGPEPDTISYLIKNGAQISEVQVEMRERMSGKSYLNFTRSIAYMVRMSISIIIIQNFRKRNHCFRDNRKETKES